MVSKEILLSQLPPYQDKWILIKDRQDVRDIVKEELEAHDQFAADYDKIALYFDTGNTKQICNTLYDFCRDNLVYNEESEKFQSLSLPTGYLTRGECDCKGYASFCGGILDALNRSGKKINWCYRFASYDFFDKDPHHVFIVVSDNGQEIWIDPTPGSDSMVPTWLTDKKISAMPLYRNIAGVHNTVGKSSLTLAPIINQNPLWWGDLHKYDGVFNPFLGMSHYRSDNGDRNLNSDEMAAQLNQLIAQGPFPGHTVDGSFVDWIYDNDVRNWNFYWPMGVRPGFTAKDILPAGYPRLIITDDGRLTLDQDKFIDDYRNPEIYLITAWAQDLVNQYDPNPYPVKPQALKEFSEDQYGNVNERNLFTERRGTSFLQDVGKAIEHTLNDIKADVLTIVGAIPRNAFLSLVGLNVFHMATHLAESIADGHWDEISHLWTGIGGDPEKLQNTISHGSGLPAITDQATSVDVDASQNTIGVVQVAAIIAAAAPVVAMLLKFMNKDGSMDSTASTISTALTTATGQTYSFQNGTLTANGLPVTYTTSTGTTSMLPTTATNNLFSNPILLAALAALLGYVIPKQKEKKMQTALLFGGGTYLLLTMLKKPATTTTIITTPATTQVAQPASGGGLLPGIIKAITTIFQPSPAAAAPAGGGITNLNDLLGD